MSVFDQYLETTLAERKLGAQLSKDELIDFCAQTLHNAGYRVVHPSLMEQSRPHPMIDQTVPLIHSGPHSGGVYAEMQMDHFQLIQTPKDIRRKMVLEQLHRPIFRRIADKYLTTKMHYTPEEDGWKFRSFVPARELTSDEHESQEDFLSKLNYIEEI